MPKPTQPIDERLAARLEAQPNGCLEFTGFLNSKGYGRINGEIGGTNKQWFAHRAAWMLAHGPIPDGMVVCHHCDNPPCCNVEHLFLGTPTDNIRDMIAKGRGVSQVKTHCKHGHEFNSANSFIDTRGHRCCRICRRERDNYNRARRERLKREGRWPESKSA